MLCRVLLAAVCISCTFPRVIVQANSQTPQALKDLVCTLFLSGVQKEDLEATLLKKLQHHNIDYDKNNEKLRVECLNNANKNISNINADNAQNQTEKKISASTNTTTSSIATTSATTELNFVSHPVKQLVKNVNMTKNKTSIETVLPSRNNDTEQTTNKRDDISKLSSEEKIGRIVSKYLSKQNTVSTTILSTTISSRTTEPIDKLASDITAIHKLNENIAILLRNINAVNILNSNASIQSNTVKPKLEVTKIQSKKDPNFTETTVLIPTPDKNHMVNIGIAKNQPTLSRNNISNSVNETTDRNNPEIKTPKNANQFKYNVLELISPVNNLSNIFATYVDEQIQSPIRQEDNQMPYRQSPQNNSINQNLMINMSKETEKYHNSLFSNMISKIADVVKDIVIKDLRKEIISSMRAISQMTSLQSIINNNPTEIITTSPKVNITEETPFTTAPSEVTTVSPIFTTSVPSKSINTSQAATFAEIVKNIVLKDLKKEIISSIRAISSMTSFKSVINNTPTEFITTSSKVEVEETAFTTTPAEATSVSPIFTSFIPLKSIYTSEAATADNTNKTQIEESSKIQGATQIDKLIQLFNKINFLSDSELTSYSEQRKPKIDIAKPKLNDGGIGGIVVVPPDPLNPLFGMEHKGVPSKEMAVDFHNYLPPSMTHSHFSTSFVTAVDETNSLADRPKPKTIEQHQFPNAEMIQHNIQEIQPLGVLMIKPEALNMNIVMSTPNSIWTRQERDLFNYMYKNSKTPEKGNVKSMKNTLNVYTNDKTVDDVPVNLKDRNIDDAAQQGTNSKNATESADTIEQVRNQIIIPRNNNDLMSITNTLANKINLGNIINNSNYKELFQKLTDISQLLKREGNSKEVPNNSSDENKAIRYHSYKEFSNNLNNIQQNEAMVHLTDPYQRPNFEILNQFENSPAQYITKEQIFDEVNKIYRDNLAPKPFKPTLNNENLLADINNFYLKLVSDSKMGNITPLKGISYSLQPNQYEQIQSFNSMSNDGNKYFNNLHPPLDTRYQANNNQNYVNKPTNYDSYAPIAIDNVEHYIDTPNRIGSYKEMEYVRQPFQNPNLSNEFSSWNKMPQFREPEQYRNTDGKESTPDYRSRENFRPYQVIENIQHKNDKTKLDIVKELFGSHSQRTIDERELSSNNNHWPQIEPTDVRRPHQDPNSGFKYDSNVRGFHKKLESRDVRKGPVGNYEKNMNNIPSMKIISREQKPMTAKTSGKYDDSRFKKFLKTQQKVNQMLESILDSKGGQIESSETNR